MKPLFARSDLLQCLPMGAPATDLFLALTPDKVLEAVEAAGLRCNPVCYPLNSFENRVYEVELVDRSRIIAKFYRPGRWSEEQILEEHRFLSELDEEEIPVCPTAAFPDGATLKQIDDIYYSLAERRGGRAPDELDDAAVRRLGMLVGRLHNVGARRDAPSRVRMCADHFIREPIAWLDEHGTVPQHFERRYFSAARKIAAVADERMAADVETLRVHGDLHLGNVLFRDGRLRVLDFDDMAVGPAVQDLWLALPGRDLETRRQRELFIEAYQQFRLFDRSTLRLIEPLRGMRMVHYAAWLARRWHDPAFQMTWPQFGSDEYWQNQTNDLEEQVEAIADDARFATPPPTDDDESEEDEEPTLTNKDFFWDWEGD